MMATLPFDELIMLKSKRIPVNFSALTIFNQLLLGTPKSNVQSLEHLFGAPLECFHIQSNRVFVARCFLSVNIFFNFFSRYRGHIPTSRIIALRLTSSSPTPLKHAGNYHAENFRELSGKPQWLQKYQLLDTKISLVLSF